MNTTIDKLERTLQEFAYHLLKAGKKGGGKGNGNGKGIGTGKVRGGKYYKREIVNGRMKYYYTQEQYEKEHKKDTEKKKQGIFDAFLSFFKVKSPDEGKEKIKQEYTQAKSSIPGISLDDFQKYTLEYFANRAKIEAKIKEAKVEKKDGEPKAAKEPTEGKEPKEKQPSEPKEKKQTDPKKAVFLYWHNKLGGDSQTSPKAEAEEKAVETPKADNVEEKQPFYTNAKEEFGEMGNNFDTMPEPAPKNIEDDSALEGRYSGGIEIDSFMDPKTGQKKYRLFIPAEKDEFLREIYYVNRFIDEKKDGRIEYVQEPLKGYDSHLEFYDGIKNIIKHRLDTRSYKKENPAPKTPEVQAKIEKVKENIEKAKAKTAKLPENISGPLNKKDGRAVYEQTGKISKDNEYVKSVLDRFTDSESISPGAFGGVYVGDNAMISTNGRTLFIIPGETDKEEAGKLYKTNKEINSLKSISGGEPVPETLDLNIPDYNYVVETAVKNVNFESDVKQSINSLVINNIKDYLDSGEGQTVSGHYPMKIKDSYFSVKNMDNIIKGFKSLGYNDIDLIGNDPNKPHIIVPKGEKDISKVPHAVIMPMKQSDYEGALDLNNEKPKSASQAKLKAVDKTAKLAEGKKEFLATKKISKDNTYFRSIIERAVGKEDTQFVFNGFKVEKGKAVASDGRRLLVIHGETDPSEEGKIYTHSKGAKYEKSRNPDHDGTIEGEFPEYESVIPKEPNKIGTLKIDETLEKIKQAEDIYKEKNKSLPKNEKQYPMVNINGLIYQARYVKDNLMALKELGHDSIDYHDNGNYREPGVFSVSGYEKFNPNKDFGVIMPLKQPKSDEEFNSIPKIEI